MLSQKTCYKYKGNIVPTDKFKRGDLQGAVCSQFPPVKYMKQFGITRPNKWVKDYPVQNAGYIKPKLGGIGDYDIQRHGFEAVPILARDKMVNFDRLEVKNIGSVSLSKDTIDLLMNISVPDETDHAWLVEKQRLTDEFKADGLSIDEITKKLKSILPLGREQRMVNKKGNPASQNNLTMDQKIKELYEELQAGMLSTKKGQIKITNQLTTILKKSLDSIVSLNQTATKKLTEIFEQVEIKEPAQFNLVGQYFDLEHYKENSGIIQFLALKNAVDKGIDLKTPLMGLTKRVGLEGIKTNFESNLSIPKFLDIKNFAIQNLEAMATIVKQNNIPITSPIYQFSKLNIEKIEHQIDPSVNPHVTPKKPRTFKKTPSTQ